MATRISRQKQTCLLRVRLLVSSKCLTKGNVLLPSASCPSCCSEFQSHNLAQLPLPHLDAFIRKLKKDGEKGKKSSVTHSHTVSSCAAGSHAAAGGVSAPAGFPDLSPLGSPSPWAPPLRTGKQAFLLCHALYHTGPPQVHGCFALLNYVFRINHGKGARGGTCLYLERLWKHVRAGMGGQAHKPLVSENTDLVFRASAWGGAARSPNCRSHTSPRSCPPKAAWQSPRPMLTLSPGDRGHTKNTSPSSSFTGESHGAYRELRPHADGWLPGVAGRRMAPQRWPRISPQNL